jgi:hypothetical protein
MKEINLNVTSFVIPNTASKMTEFHGKELYFKNIHELNNIEYNENNKIVQLWSYNHEELKCDNIGNHKFKLEIDGITETMFMVDLTWIPYELIKDCKEGDVVTFKFPYMTHDIHDVTSINMIFNINMKCQQAESRYRRFGNFEDVVKSVMRI